MGCQEQYRSSSDKRQDLSIVQQVLKQKHLLIAEDNAVNQMVIIGMLKRLGITADIANHGKEALALYQQQPQHYHLVLMDCEMPEMEVIKRHNRYGNGNTSIICHLLILSR